MILLSFQIESHFNDTMAYAQNSKTTSLPRKDCIISMWTEGESYRNIAKRLGISSQAVSKIVVKFATSGSTCSKQSAHEHCNIDDNVEIWGGDRTP